MNSKTASAVVGALLAFVPSTLLSAPSIIPNCTPSSVFAEGVETVGKISDLRREGKLAEAVALLATVQGSEQLKSMACFALYRDDKSRTAEMNALLRRVAAIDETTFWGTAAMGLLRMRDDAPISLYWPWKKNQLVSPETTIVSGVERKFKVPGHYSLTVKGPAEITAMKLTRADGQTIALTAPFEFELPPGAPMKSLSLTVKTAAEGEIVVNRRVLKPRGTAAFTGLKSTDAPAAAYIRRVVGEETINAIGSKEGGAEFLTRFFGDVAWMEQFAGSGPWSCESRQGLNENLPKAAKALEALDLLVWNDDGSIARNRSVRDMATALALNHGAEKSAEWLVEVAALYRGWIAEGSLVPAAASYDVREWREVVGFGQNLWLTPEDYRWSHDFTALHPSEDYGAMCWQCSYRTYNCFGDSIHGPDYYKPWDHRLLHQEERYYVGGVCGSLSKFGSLIAATHGIKSFTAGQPAHCAYLLWDYAKARWNIAYSVTGHTMPHNSLGGSGFAAANEQQLYYAHPDRMAAERLRWQGKFEEAMRRVPGNWCAAVGWFNELERTKAPIAAYEAYAAAVRETFGEMPSQGFQLYLPYLAKLTNREAKIAAAAQALAALRESPRESSEGAYFDEIALNPLKSLFGSDSEAFWSVYESALAGQAGTPTFFRQTVNWGSANLIKDDASRRRFLRMVAASVEKTGSQLDYKEMLLAASQKGDIEMMRQVYGLLDKCSPELKTKRNARSWPTEKGGFKLLSSDGILMTSTTSRWDWPLTYRNALDGEGYEELCAFHTNYETSPWAMVKLPGPAEVKSITIVNAGGYNTARQIPLVVWTSEDGKTFTQIASFTAVQPEWTVELAVPQKARYVKVGRKPDDRREVFHLYKILVYGKKLY